MAEQFKSMSPEDVREKKMHDKMGVAAEKARENSLGKADKPKLPEPELVNEKVKKSAPKKTTPTPTPTPVPDEIADKLQSQKNETKLVADCRRIARAFESPLPAKR